MRRHGAVCGLCPLIITTTIIIIIHMVNWIKPQTVNEYDAYMDAGFRGLEGNAFYALRSCHQVLRGDSGEFFSPDYLCSSPSLWCNWTIQVPHGKRVKLYLEDLTPDHACHLKMDQIHLDESPVAAGGSQILERCWQSASYTSISNTVHVVQLIGPILNPPHRGFYGQYQAFGPVEPPPEPPVDPGTVNEDLHEREGEEDKEEEEQEEEEEKEPVEVMQAPDEVVHMDNALVDLVEVSSVTHPWTNELPAAGIWEKVPPEVRKTRGGAEDQAAAAAAVVEEVLDYIPEEDYTPQPSVPTYSTPTPATSPETTPVLSTVGVDPPLTMSAPVDKHQTAQFGPKSIQPPATAPAGAETDVIFVEMPLVDGGGTFQAGAVDLEEMLQEDNIQLNSTGKTKQSHRNKGSTLPVHTIRHQAEPPHLPGGVLLEVSLEVGVHRAHRENWDHIRNAFMSSAEHMIEKQLESLHLKSISSKRSKRLNAGVLVIVWVQFGSGQEEELQSTLQNLKGKSLKAHGTNSHGTISSVSVEDINECETRLVMCDVNAECVNEFGSYSCHCLHGYSPGLGGAMCVDPKNEECSRTFPILLYVVCVLLGFLIALLLLVLCVIYRRYHRGAFLPHCHSNSTRSFNATASDGNNNNNSNSERGLNGGGDPCSSRPLPPPPPLRLPREPPATLDLPLLKFTPLAPSGGFEGKLQSEKDEL